MTLWERDAERGRILVAHPGGLSGATPVWRIVLGCVGAANSCPHDRRENDRRGGEVRPILCTKGSHKSSGMETRASGVGHASDARGQSWLIMDGEGLAASGAAIAQALDSTPTALRS